MKFFTFVIFIILVFNKYQAKQIGAENFLSKVSDAADGLHALLAEMGSPLRITVPVCWRLGNCYIFCLRGICNFHS